jgi:hypothetical protein
VLLALWLSLALHVPVDKEVAHLRFHSAFWPNLHHTLYAASLSSGRPLGSPVKGTLTEGMTADERAAWERAVAFYAREMASKDLRTGDGMSKINNVLAEADDDGLSASAALEPEHRTALEAAAPAYRRVLWPRYDKANQAWIADVASRLEQIAPAVVPRLSRVFGTPWFTASVRIDVTYHGRAYTSLNPAIHSTIASGDPQYAGWAGVEMVLHEVSHGLVVERLDATLAAQAAAAGKDSGDLGHLALFYMVGEITRQAVAERQTAYTPFLYAAGVIDRGWPSQRGIVEAHLKPYVDEGAMTMETAMKGWMQDGKLFAFRSGFWVNLHHFLYVLGRARNGAADSRRAAVVKAPADVEGLAARTESERAAWDESIHYYAGGLSTKDAVFDAALVDIARKLAGAPDDADPAALGVPPELASTLKLAAPVYRAVWWPRHARANAARRDDLQAFVDRHGAAAVKRLTTLYQTQWPARPRTIDLVAYANWAGAYSTDGGLIVFASTDEDISGGLGLETLLHESSHQWDEEIERRLAVIAAKQGKPVPGGLSHAMIFYTSGAIVSELIPGHAPYADKSGIWTRGANPALKPLLDRYWRPYIRGTGTFEEAAAKLLDAR